MSNSLNDLTQRHQALIAQQRSPFTLRMHRALSWLQRADAAGADDDVAFVCLWIAFNAAYAQEIPHHQRLSEQETFQAFLQKLHGLDREKQLDSLVWKEFSGPVRILLDNPYVFESFWDFHRGLITEADWQARFTRGKQRAHKLLAQGHTPELLAVVFQRIYTLRNQLMHGGATWNSMVNRAQLQDCVNLMSKLVPVVIEIMLNGSDTIWGDACYPVVSN